MTLLLEAMTMDQGYLKGDRSSQVRLVRQLWSWLLYTLHAACAATGSRSGVDPVVLQTRGTRRRH